MAFGIVGAIIGAKISINLDTGKLKTYFGIFLLIIATVEIFTLINKYKKKN